MLFLHGIAIFFFLNLIYATFFSFNHPVFRNITFNSYIKYHLVGIPQFTKQFPYFWICRLFSVFYSLNGIAINVYAHIDFYAGISPHPSLILIPKSVSTGLKIFS